MASAPRDAVTDFYDAVADGRTTKAADMLTGGAVAVLGHEKLTAYLDEQTGVIARKGGIDEIAILSEEVNGNSASVTYVIRYANGEEDPEEDSQLVRIDGVWRLVVEL